MTCRDFDSRLFDLEERVADTARLRGAAAADPDIAAHLAECPACRRRLELYCRSRLLLVAWSALAADPAEVAGVMERIRRETALEEHRPLVLRAWIPVGLILIVGLAALPFSSVFSYLKQAMGDIVSVTVSLALGFALTAYIFLVVASQRGRAGDKDAGGSGVRMGPLRIGPWRIGPRRV